MTTDISVHRVQHHTENRSWLLSPHGTEPGTTPSLTLDISTFVPATHYPDGFIPSGCIVQYDPATKLWFPYANAASPPGILILFGSLKVPASGANPAGAGVVHGFVDPAKLPFQSGAGSLGTNGRAALRLIHFKES